MSVILTAGRKAVKPKSAKPKRKKPRPTFDPTPPLSTAETTVWHWKLDGIPTTVMFSKGDDRIWCNGSFLDGQCEFMDDSNGAVYKFCLEVKPKCAHAAELRRVALGGKGKKNVLCHQLFVDCCMILEHTSNQTCQVYDPTAESFGAMACPPAYYENPPSYDEIENDKKTK